MWPRWDRGHQFGTVPLCRTVSPWDSLWISFLDPFLLAEEPPHPPLVLHSRPVGHYWPTGQMFSLSENLCLRPFLCFSQRDILWWDSLIKGLCCISQQCHYRTLQWAGHSFRSAPCLHPCAPGEGSGVKCKLQVQFYEVFFEISIIFWATRMCVATDCDSVAHTSCTWGSPHLWYTCSAMLFEDLRKRSLAQPLAPLMFSHSRMFVFLLCQASNEPTVIWYWENAAQREPESARLSLLH